MMRNGVSLSELHIDRYTRGMYMLIIPTQRVGIVPEEGGIINCNMRAS